MGRLFAAVAGPLAALVVCVRLQLALLERFPGSEPAALAAGWAAAGAVLALTLIAVVRLWVPRLWLLLLAGAPVLLLGAGVAAVSLAPSGWQADVAGTEWSRLHPALRSALRLVHLGDVGLAVTAAGRDAADEAWAAVPPPRYARAVDLDLADVGPWRAWLSQGLFLACGLRAEVTAGAAQHLHVWVPVPAPIAAAPHGPAPPRPTGQPAPRVAAALLAPAG